MEPLYDKSELTLLGFDIQYALHLMDVLGGCSSLILTALKRRISRGLPARRSYSAPVRSWNVTFGRSNSGRLWRDAPREPLHLAQLRSSLKYFCYSRLPLSNTIIDTLLLFSFGRPLRLPFFHRGVFPASAQSARVRMSNDALVFFLGTGFKQKYTACYPPHTCKEEIHPLFLTLTRTHTSQRAAGFMSTALPSKA